MKKYAQMIWLILLGFLLVGCGQAVTSKEQVTLTPTNTRAISKTPNPTHTPDSTSTPRPTSRIKPTETLTPIPTSKNSLIELSQGAGDGVDEMMICMGVYSPYPRFILYEDGQLIFYKSGEGGYQEAHLSQKQIGSLLGKIEAAGYFKVGDTFQEQYDLPEGVETGGGGWGMVISVKDKSVDIDPNLEEYLLKPVKDTLDVVENYQPDGEIKAYIPGTISLSVMEASADGPFPTPEPSRKIDSWPTGLFSLKPGDQHDLSKNEMQTLTQLGFFTRVPSLRLFKQGGAAYYVLGCPPWYGW